MNNISFTFLNIHFLIVPSSSVRNLTTSTTQLNATSILVTWNVPVLNDLNGVLLNYSINYSGIEIDTVPRVIYLSNPTLTNQSIILTNLEEYTTYSINVSAYTKVGRGPDAVVSQRTNQDGEYIHCLSGASISIYNPFALTSSIQYSHIPSCHFSLLYHCEHHLGTSSLPEPERYHNLLHTELSGNRERHTTAYLDSPS